MQPLNHLTRRQTGPTCEEIAGLPRPHCRRDKRRKCLPRFPCPFRHWGDAAAQSPEESKRPWKQAAPPFHCLAALPQANLPEGQATGRSRQKRLDNRQDNEAEQCRDGYEKRDKKDRSNRPRAV